MSLIKHDYAWCYGKIIVDVMMSCWMGTSKNKLVPLILLD